MGEAFVAVADDINSLHYNPAGLSNITVREAAGMYTKDQFDASVLFLGYAQGFKHVGTFALSVLTLQTGDMDWDGKIVKASQDTVFTLGYAKKALKNFSAGLNLKMLQSSLVETYKATAYAADAGCLYQTPVKGLAAGLSLQNYGTELTFIEEGDPLPLTLRTGLSYKYKLGKDNSFILATDLVQFRNQDAKYNLGAEYNFKNMFSLRMGYKMGYDLESLTFGFGFFWNGFQFDLSQTSMETMDAAMRTSFSMKPAPPRPSKPVVLNDDTKKIYERAKYLWKAGKYKAALGKLDFIIERKQADDKINKIWKKLKWLSVILPEETGKDKKAQLVRKGMNAYIGPKTDIVLAFNFLLYSQESGKKNAAIG